MYACASAHTKSEYESENTLFFCDSVTVGAGGYSARLDGTVIG